MKPKTIRYLAYLMMILLAIGIVRVVLMGVKAQRIMNQVNEEMKTDGTEGTNQISH
jgi:hypothetical protein